MLNDTSSNNSLPNFNLVADQLSMATHHEKPLVDKKMDTSLPEELIPEPWNSPCPICDGKHGNYGLHGEWYRNGTEYCLTCNTSSNKFKFAIVA
ncbi:uncharacterized protein OCT59_002276 [Rhizophagus irregularis]|uniref:uncharacterized protein n=1 Tax=Rhizophagus irregularis TaxID=588596 RepID=UPI00331E961F|nr:hypothetical protein OCT59_002276 [Rhizophagus irregularis]